MPNVTFRAAALVLALTVTALPALAQDSAPKLDAAQMKAAVTTYYDAMNAGDLAKAKSVFAANATVEDPVGGTRRPADAFITGIFNAKPVFTVSMLTGSRTNLAAAATNLKRVGSEVNAIHIFTFNADGKIANLTVYAGPGDRTPPLPER